MAGRRLMTLDVRELVRRLRAGQKQRAIAREMDVDRKTVRRYWRLARRNHWLHGSLPTLEQMHRQLDADLPGQAPAVTQFKAAPYRAVIEALREQEVEGKTIWQRLCEDHGYTGSYSSVYRYIRHLEPIDPNACVRIETPPGQEAQVDFGYAGRIFDPIAGRQRKAWVFVMTLSHSRHMFAKIVFDQTVPTWLRCHVEAFEAFGGAPGKLVVDNLKAAIVKAVLYDPVPQRSYRDLAEHYGVLISPCRPRTPEHKGKVESGVHYIKRNFLAGRQFRDIFEANEKLARWVDQTAGLRDHGTVRWQPLIRFQDIEQAQLVPLPPTAFDLGQWKQVRLHRDCHVIVDGAYYSAPHRLVGQKLWIRTNGREVVIYHDYRRVATHQWAPPGKRQTLIDHYPPGKAKFLVATPEACRLRAKKIGPQTAAVVGRVLGDRPMDRLRTVQGILRLKDKYGPRRLEQACGRALAFGEMKLVTIKRILEKGLEAEPVVSSPAAEAVTRRPAFARVAGEIFLQLEGGR